ncbi:MAG: RimK family protein [Thermoanaerobaculia bacterium]|nr:RimK family protein [Thermoanaerobaculia bacterium]
MPAILIVERPERWPFALPEVEVVAARTYLTDPGFSTRRNLKVFNLCRSYRYLSLGYYVSLLAEARGHKPLPSVTTIQDLKSPSLVRFISEDLDDIIQRCLAPLTSDSFTLSIYFGRNMAKRYERLSLHLFNLFPAPLLRAQLVRDEGRWEIESLRAIAAKEIPDDHRAFVVESASDYFSGRRPRAAQKPSTRYDMAILVGTKGELGPSNDGAIQRFVRAAHGLGIRAEVIGRDDLGRLAEFDALFIRQTTAVNHPTYRFARRAAAEGLVVIDDPDSILRATNKVFLAELLARHKVPMPKTVILHRDNLEIAADQLGMPAILKVPDGSFSLGVERADDRVTFLEKARQFLENSDLVIAQEFLPTDFDWRVGVINRQVLFVARYIMVKGHWQIAQRDARGRIHYGGAEAVPLESVPPHVVETALKAANLIGDGLYGVDVKEVDGKSYVIEVNDNPNIDAGYEDGIVGDALYQRIMSVFLERIERLKERKSPA